MKKTILLTIAIFIAFLVLGTLFSKISRAVWYNDSWLYRKPVTVSYAGTTLSNFDVIVSMDTATLITAGKMQSDCDDIRITDSDETTLISYWIEGGCNTSSTQIWAQIPSIPNGGKTIYVYYGNGSATAGTQSWIGTFTLMYNTTCPAGWTQNADFDNSFPQGAATYGGTGGTSSHSHAQLSCTSTNSATATSDYSVKAPANSAQAHTHTGLKVDISSASNVLPPYLNVLMCEKVDLVIPANFIAMYDTTAPTGWTRFSTLDNSFPRGATAYSDSGGSSTHSHSTTGGYATGGGSSSINSNNNASFPRPTSDHTHTSSSGTTDTGNNTPPYLDMIFGQADAQTIGVANMVLITGVLPPLGWTRFTALDSKFPRGAASYGGTGGASTHTHSVTISTGGSNNNTSGASASHQSNTTSHTHDCTTTSDSQANLPPYTNAIYAQRKDPVGDNSVSTSMGNEESNVVPNAPTIGTPTALSSTSIRWNFTDNSGNEIGFKVYDSDGNLKVTCANANISYCDETGLSVNTQYTRKVLAYNNDANSTFTSTATIYTLSATPVAPTVDNRVTTTVDVTPLAGGNPASTQFAIYKEVGTACDGSGGSYLADNGSDNGSTPVWQTIASWGSPDAGKTTASGLNQDQQYSFCLYARNGDNVATSIGEAATHNSCVPGLSGNHTITTNCSFPVFTDGNNASRKVHGVDTGTGTTNTAKITVQGGILTVNSDETIVAGSFELTGGSIAIATGGQLKVGVPLYQVDADADGYPADTKLYYQDFGGSAPTNGRRRNLMSRIVVQDCDDTVSTPNGCIRRSITITYSGVTLTDHDIVFGVDTATLIAASKMQSDCGDIRVKDSDGTTNLNYWIEGGCNTSNTQIWVTVPSIPDGGKTIYLDYHGGAIADGFQGWSGTFTLMYNTTCPAGWTQNSIFDNAFPQGAATSGGTGGTSTHSHAQISCTSTNSATSDSENAVSTPTNSAQAHTHTGLKVDISSASSVIPPYLDVVMCKKADLVIPANFIAMFDATVPTGWTRFSTLDSKFPRGATAYGGTGGGTHSHSTTGNYTTGAGSSSINSNNNASYPRPTSDHTHISSNGTTDAGDNTPPYLDMVFGQADAQTVAATDLVAIVDTLPPIGWSRFTALDSKFPRGASSYGGTGGATTHTHSATVSTGGPSATTNGASASYQSNTTNHTHSCTTTTDSQSNIPPYTNAIFAERKTPTPTVSVGSTESYWW